MPFSAGWTRLLLSDCPGAGAPAVLEVVGAERRLTFTPGRAGGATLGVLSAGAASAAVERQDFATPSASARAREVVLAPWPQGSAPPRLLGVRLLAHGRP